MKLRNKKTGEVQICEAITVQTDIRIDDYTSLAELNEEWEDYKPKEPLIKDEKIRKAVRAWAEACTNDSKYLAYDVGNTYFILEADRSDAKITLYVDEHDAIEGLVENEFYTIVELCGEEKE